MSTPSASNAPSRAMDPHAMQIQILQQQLQQQQQNSLVQQQQMQEAANIAQASMQDQLKNAQSTAQLTATSTVWENISSLTLEEVCAKLPNTGEYGAGSSKLKSGSESQSIDQVSDITINKMCAAVKSGNNIAEYSIPLSNSAIQTVRLTEGDRVVSYCNPNATNAGSYQTEQCVCNQLGPNPILHTASVKSGGAFGVGATTTTGYYCLAK